MKNIAIVICLHGDELFGLEIMDKLSKNIPVFIGNPLAIEKRRRFIDMDLNRSFPGDEKGSYEEKRAAYLLNELKNFDCVIDIHSSSCDLELFGIITKVNEKNLALANKLGLKKLIIMSEKVGLGKSLIDHVPCGISLEIGPHEKKENIDEVIKAINNSNGVEEHEIEFLEVFSVIPKIERNIKILINNFKPVKKGSLIAKGKKDYYAEEDFIPLFVGEKAYENVLCLATRRINREELNKHLFS